MRVAASLTLLVAWAGVAALAGCVDTKQPPVVSGPTAADSADQVLFGVQTLLTTKGVRRGELTADTAYVLDDQTRLDLRNAHAQFTTEAGLPQGTMQSKRAVFNQRTQILEGWGAVDVKLVDGRTLRSPHVIYNQLTHQISSDTTFELHRGSDMAHGVGFTSDESFLSFRCLRACGGKASVLLPAR